MSNEDGGATGAFKEGFKIGCVLSLIWGLFTNPVACGCMALIAVVVVLFMGLALFAFFADNVLLVVIVLALVGAWWWWRSQRDSAGRPPRR